MPSSISGIQGIATSPEPTPKSAPPVIIYVVVKLTSKVDSSPAIKTPTVYVKSPINKIPLLFIHLLIHDIKKIEPIKENDAKVIIKPLKSGV